MKHLQLNFAAEISLVPRYKCPVCGNELWSEKSYRTGFKEFLKTKDGQRHFKKRCNLKNMR